MQRDMKDLKEKAAASAKSAEYERNLARQLENDLKKVCAELEDEKKTAAHNKKIAEKAIKDLNTGLDRYRTGVKVMTQHIFGELCSFFAFILTINPLLCYTLENQCFLIGASNLMTGREEPRRT